jgi:hypothetical protein
MLDDAARPLSVSVSARVLLKKRPYFFVGGVMQAWGGNIRRN